MTMNRTSWYSKAKILEVKYEYPILRMISGVKKDKQDFYDNSPFLHGSMVLMLKIQVNFSTYILSFIA